MKYYFLFLALFILKDRYAASILRTNVHAVL